MKNQEKLSNENSKNQYWANDIFSNPNQKELPLNTHKENFSNQSILTEADINNLFGSSINNCINISNEKFKDCLNQKLPNYIRHSCDVKDFPLLSDNSIIDSFKLKVIYDRECTNLESDIGLDLSIGNMIGGRYRIGSLLGRTSFSRVFSCEDMLIGGKYCLKVVENQKVLFDQSIEEIKM